MAGNALDALLALLPKGPAWTRWLDSVMRQLLTGAAVEFGRVQERSDQSKLETESPSTADETISDWEHMVGLPSECTPIVLIPDDPEEELEDRREEVLKRWLRCGQWAPHVGADFLIDRIAELGYIESDIELRRFHFPPYTCESECDDYLNSEDVGWFCIYEFIVISGDDDARVICEIEKRYGQAHLGFTFAFPLTRWDRGTFTRTGGATLKHPETLIESSLASNTMGQFYYGV